MAPGTVNVVMAGWLCIHLTALMNSFFSGRVNWRLHDVNENEDGSGWKIINCNIPLLPYNGVCASDLSFCERDAGSY